MKRLLLLPFLCLMPAAQAMDYVKCEAIQKANERATQSRMAVYKSLQSKYRPEIERELCGSYPNVMDYVGGSDPLAYSKAGLNHAKCISRNIDESHSRMMSLMEQEPSYIEAKARQAKIQADYKAEGCY